MRYRLLFLINEALISAGMEDKDKNKKDPEQSGSLHFILYKNII